VPKEGAALNCYVGHRSIGSLGQRSLQSGVPSSSWSVSSTLQPQMSGVVFKGSSGQSSMISGVPSPSESRGVEVDTVLAVVDVVVIVVVDVDDVVIG